MQEKKPLNPDVKIRLENFIIEQTNKEKSFNQRSLANALGISQGLISALRSGNYTGDVTKQERKIIAYLDREEQKKLDPKKELGFVETTSAKRIFEIARYCHNKGEIGVVTGNAGLGKTKALKEYHRQNYQDTILIEADLGYSARTLFRDLLRQVNMEIFAQLHDMFEIFVSKVIGTNKLIIIDEAEHLHYKALELIRRVNDKSGAGILLAGMPVLRNNLMGRKQQYQQLYSRVGLAYELDKLTLDDTQQIIKNTFPEANGIYKDFYELSRGNARVLSKLVSHVDRILKLNKKHPLTKGIVEKASKLLIQKER